MKKLIWTVLAVIVCLQGPGAAPVFAERGCTTTREYVTTLEFLRHRREFDVSEQQAQLIAKEVSQGCTGAARRFILVSSALSQAGLTSQDAFKAGIEFSIRTDSDADAFVTVFQKAYLEDALDLDVGSAMKLARQLSSEFDGDTVAAREDFEKLVSYCVSAKHLDLPRPQCAIHAVRLVKLGQGWGGGIAAPFIQAFEFLRSDSGPELSTADAFPLAEKLVSATPDSVENFISGYKYAVSKHGLDLPREQAIEFAREMAFTPAKAKQPSNSK